MAGRGTIVQRKLSLLRSLLYMRLVRVDTIVQSGNEVKKSEGLFPA